MGTKLWNPLLPPRTPLPNGPLAFGCSLSRNLGIPVCARWVGKLVFTPDEIANLISADVPPSVQLHMRGGLPIRFEAASQEFRDRASVTIWAVTPIPARMITDGEQSDGGDDADPDPSHEDDSSTSLVDRERSRSPRRHSRQSAGSDATNDRGLSHSGRESRHAQRQDQTDVEVSPLLWMPGFTQHAFPHCPPADTPDWATSLLTPCQTALQSSPIHLRQRLMGLVWSGLMSYAWELGSSHSLSNTDLNHKDLSGEGPCTRYLAQHLEDCEPIAPPPSEALGDKDLPRGQCQVNWSDAKQQDLLSFLPWSSLRPAPQGLEKPDRFQSWIAGCTIHVRPSPEEELCIHSDGSFVPGSTVAGWGLVFSKRPAGALDSEGTFIGCAWGSYASVAPFFEQLQHMLDAHLMEVAGLMWAAVAVMQLRYFGRVTFESDCQSALSSAKGMGRTRQHPLCRAMAALHMCVRVSMRDTPSYSYVPGHSGTSRNELADALAHFGSHHPGSEGPLQLQLPLWFQNDPDGFAWAPHAFLCREQPNCMPDFAQGLIQWEARIPEFQKNPSLALKPFLPAEVLQAQPMQGQTDTLLFRVASLNTLSLLEADDALPGRCRQGLYGEVGRTALLAPCLASKGIHIAGLQEARTPTGQVVSNGFLRLCSGPDQTGNYGNEVWISLDSPFGAKHSTATKVQRPDAVVLHSEPSLLIIRLRTTFLHLIIASMHAPHRAHTMEHRVQWWQHATRVCLSIDREDAWVLALDGNIRVGSHVSESIGGWHADPEDEAAAAAHQLFMRLRVFLPATFQENMRGEGGTLFQKRNGRLDRSDFVALPLAWADTCPLTWIDPEIHVGHKALDHLSAVAEVKLQRHVRQPRKAARPRIDAASIRDEANHSRICRIIADAPRCPWNMNVHEHVASLVGYLQSSLADAFPAPRLRQRPSFLSANSLELHRTLAATRSKLRQRCDALRLSRMACAFDVSRSSRLEDTFCSAFQGSWLADLHCHIAIDVFRVQTYSAVLKKSSRQDKAAHISQLAVDLCQAAPSEVHTAF